MAKYVSPDKLSRFLSLLKNIIPTKTSDLTNDSNFVSETDGTINGIDHIITKSGTGLFEIDGKQVSYDNHKHSEYAAASHTHAIKSKFDLTTHTTPNLTTAANTNAPARTMAVTNPGYYPLGIVGFTFSGTNYGDINLFSCYFVHADNADGSGTISYRYRNNSSSSFSGNIKFRVLWVKTT